MQASRRMSASVWDMSLLSPTPPFSKGSDVNWISCTQLLKKVYGFFFPRQSYFLLQQRKKKWTADVLTSEREWEGWIGVTFWEKGMPTMCDTSTSTVAPATQPCTCLRCPSLRGALIVLFIHYQRGLVLEAASPLSLRGAAPLWVLSLARLQGLQEVHSSSMNTALIRQQLCKIFLSSSALKLIYPFHTCQNMSDITSVISWDHANSWLP